MSNLFKKTLLKLTETRYRYLLSHSNVRINARSQAQIDRSVAINRSTIIGKCATISIGENCTISNALIHVKNGTLTVAPHTTIKDCFIEIDDGIITIGDHSRIQCRHIWIRFGGRLSIGSYTNLNRGTEVRSDECIEIGSYCQISYNVNIWDTNTHNVLPPDERKRIAEQYFPRYGHEEIKPQTKPIRIGDNCWIGEYATIMKGTMLGDNVVVGYHTMLIGQQIEENKKVVQQIDIRVI